MNNMRYTAFIILALMFGCSAFTGNKSVRENDSHATNIEEDSTSTASYEEDIDEYDRVPGEFKAEYPDEWAVVNASVNIQQKGDDIDFGKIDLLVKDYLAKKKIPLPRDVNRRIKCIEDVCKTKFSIEGYDDSNMGLIFANGTSFLFDMYINWLYEKEAKKVLSRNRLVNIEREQKLYKNLNDAMYDVCDSVAFCMGGSCYWYGATQVQHISIDFHKSMYQAIIGASLELERELDVPLNLFDKECKALNDNYKPFDDDLPKDVSQIVNRFKNAFHSWYAYRKSVAANLRDKKFKKAYESITYSYARIHFLHLKNRFSDIGLMSDDMVELCLKDDCTNQELLDFNYETRWKELFKNMGDVN